MSVMVGAHRNVAQRIGIVGVGLLVGRQYHLIRSDGRRRGGLQHLVHHHGQGVSDAQLAVHNGAQHIHAGLGGARWCGRY